MSVDIYMDVMHHLIGQGRERPLEQRCEKID